MNCLESWLIYQGNPQRVKIQSVTKKVMKLKAYHYHFVGVKVGIYENNIGETRRFLAEIAFFLCRKRGVSNASKYLNPLILMESIKVLRNEGRPQRSKPDPQTLEARKTARRARKLATSQAGPQKGSTGSCPALAGGKTKSARKRIRAGG